MRRVASVADTTHGMPSSRLTITACDIAAPTSTTTAAAGTNSGVHDGSVLGATSTSPGSRPVGSNESSTTRARPVALPGQPGNPVSVSPAVSTAATPSPRCGPGAAGGASRSNTNGSRRSANTGMSAARSRMRSRNRAGSARNASSSSSRRKPKSATSAKWPVATMRRPSSYMHRRASWIMRTTVVLHRSRAGSISMPARSTPSNWASRSGSPASLARMLAVAASRWAAMDEVCPVGSADASARRIRSMAARASSGFVSQFGERISHSLGPREPNS